MKERNRTAVKPDKNRGKRKLNQYLTVTPHVESIDAANHVTPINGIVKPTNPTGIKFGHDSAAKSSVKSGKNLDWVKLPDHELLKVRMCDLNLQIERTPLEAVRTQLYQELTDRNLRIRPHCWLSDEWFAPDGIPGIAIPFYLAHPRLIRLERRQMLEVEGGTREWCMRILRHEAGHAVDTAFGLHRRKQYREIFGHYSAPYPEFYRPKPRSKNFVQHLEPWYAQSHPAEDFAETFAVWLAPGERWKKDYAGWRAMRKLCYIDQLMTEIAGTAMKNRSRRQIDPISKLKKTLGEHYEDRHQRYNINYTTSFDDDLLRLFASPESGHAKKAAAFLRKNRNAFCRTISQWTGEYRYNINQVIREMIDRCRILDLRVADSGDKLKQDTLIMMTVHTMNYLYRGNHQVAL